MTKSDSQKDPNQLAKQIVDISTGQVERKTPDRKVVENEQNNN